MHRHRDRRVGCGYAVGTGEKGGWERQVSNIRLLPLPYLRIVPGWSGCSRSSNWRASQFCPLTSPLHFFSVPYSPDWLCTPSRQGGCRLLFQLFATPGTAAQQASLPFTIPQSLLKLVSTELVMPSNHLILCHPLLLLLSIFPSIRIFSKELALRFKWPKYWSFSFSISPSKECSGSFSFRLDWFEILAAKGTLKSLFQHHSSKASILQCTAFFMVQLSHPYMTTRKHIALTIWTVVRKVMSLLFNTLSRSVIAFLPGLHAKKYGHWSTPDVASNAPLNICLLCSFW